LLHLKGIDCNSWQIARCSIASWYWQTPKALRPPKAFLMPSLVASVEGRKFSSRQGAILLVTLATAKGCLSGCQWNSLPSLCNVDNTGVDCFTPCAVDARLIVFDVFYLPKKRSNRLVLQARLFLSQHCAIVVCASHHPCHDETAPVSWLPLACTSSALLCQKKTEISGQATASETASCSNRQVCTDASVSS